METEKVSKEKAVADEEERKVAAFAVVVTGKQRDCEEDLAKAEPALIAAQDALNTLNKVCYLTPQYTLNKVCYLTPQYTSTRSVTSHLNTLNKVCYLTPQHP